MKMPRRSNSSPQARTLFTALLQQPQTWRHGYDLSKDTLLKSGTLYPLLMRLSHLGLLESRWEDPEKPGRPPRHAYRLTATGLVFARDTTLASAAPAPTGRTGEVPA